MLFIYIPKITNRVKYTFQLIFKEILGIDFQLKPSGGCCDGNNLSHAGLSNIDTVGVRGGNIHTDKEYVFLDSLKERAKLVLLLLIKLEEGEIKWKK